MKNKSTEIPMQLLADEIENGLSVAHLFLHTLDDVKDAVVSHRHDYHLFLLLESGSLQIEIDFESFHIQPYALVYIHPHQVHRFLHVDDANTFLLAIKSDFLRGDNSNMLDTISFLKPQIIPENTFRLLVQSLSLCIAIKEQENQEFFAALIDNSNGFVSLTMSPFYKDMARCSASNSGIQLSRGFSRLLNQLYIAEKSPKNYALLLNVSPSYLNECVKKSTGIPVSEHIKQRIILEAKRLLFHSPQTVKEIAVALGFDDVAYFSRMFKKYTGVPAGVFRAQNRE